MKEKKKSLSKNVEKEIPKKKLTLFLDEDTHSKLSQIAEHEHRSLHSQIVHLIQKHIEERFLIFNEEESKKMKLFLEENKGKEIDFNLFLNHSLKIKNNIK
jgi:hypothetical protein